MTVCPAFEHEMMFRRDSSPFILRDSVDTFVGARL